MANQSFSYNMRVIHRYLGFFLAGIMAMYALSGIVLIFRDTDFLKNKTQVVKQVKANAKPDELGGLLKMKVKEAKDEGNLITFKDGTYDKSTGTAQYTQKELPYVLDKMTHLHKAETKNPLFFLNIFFGLSLLFFVISSFWMFMPQTEIFKKGLYFTIAGIVLTLILIFI